MENKYYVYLHRNVFGEVFYVGKGTGYRVKERGHRSKDWRDMASKGFTYQIVKDNMSSAEALDLEKRIIQIYEATIVNKVKSNVVRELDFEFFNKFLSYDAGSPSGLVWKIDTGGRNNSKFKTGTPAGSKCIFSETSGCWKLGLEGNDYLNHRVIWLLTHGTISSDEVVDHLNGDPWDNRIENLALKSRANNARNRAYGKQSTEMLGVSISRYKTGQVYFTATWICENGKSNNKKFSIKKYGENEAFNLACAYRLAQIKRLQGLGLDYTDRHIKSTKK